MQATLGEAKQAALEFKKSFEGHQDFKAHPIEPHGQTGFRTRAVLDDHALGQLAAMVIHELGFGEKLRAEIGNAVVEGVADGKKTVKLIRFVQKS
jgi:hypothetical protein